MVEISEREVPEGPPALLFHGHLCHDLAQVVQKGTGVVCAGVDGGGEVDGAGGDFCLDKTEAVVAITAQGVVNVR